MVFPNRINEADTPQEGLVISDWFLMFRSKVMPKRVRFIAFGVVDGNVIAEDRTRIRVRLLDGRACEADEDAFGSASRTCPASPSTRSYCERCASSAMMTMFRRSLRQGIFSPFSGRTFWIVVETPPPPAVRRRFFRLAACTGTWPRMSCAPGTCFGRRGAGRAL